MTQRNTNTPRKHKPHVMVILGQELRDEVERIAELEQRPLSAQCRLWVIEGLRRHQADTAQADAS